MAINLIMNKNVRSTVYRFNRDCINSENMVSEKINVNPIKNLYSKITPLCSHLSKDLVYPLVLIHNKGSGISHKNTNMLMPSFNLKLY